MLTLNKTLLFLAILVLLHTASHSHTINCKMFEFKAVAEVQIKYVARLNIVLTVHDAIHALCTNSWLDRLNL